MKIKSLIVLILFGLLGCSNKQSAMNRSNLPIEKTKHFIVKIGPHERLDEFTIVVIDSCEYFSSNGQNVSHVMFHKGNCKFCIERNKLAYKRIIKEIKRNLE